MLDIGAGAREQLGMEAHPAADFQNPFPLQCIELHHFRERAIAVDEQAGAVDEALVDLVVPGRREAFLGNGNGEVIAHGLIGPPGAIAALPLLGRRSHLRLLVILHDRSPFEQASAISSRDAACHLCIRKRNQPLVTLARSERVQ